MHSYPLVALISARAGTLGLLAWDAAAVMIMLLALARLLRSARELFAYGMVSKCAWAIACIWFTWHWDAALVPTGALVVLWHLSQLVRRSRAAGRASVPMATGRAPGSSR